MRVLLHPADQEGCGHYRLFYPAQVAEREGVEVEITNKLPRSMIVDGPRAGDIVVHRPEADVSVFQRPCRREVVEAIRQLIEMGHPVIIDVDDDFSAIHPHHVGWDLLHSDEVNAKHLIAACKLATLVTVTTEALAERYGAHGRVAVLPNCVPESLLSMPSKSDGKTLGWTGNIATHPGDLEVVGLGVREALERVGWHFQVIGRMDGVAEKLGLGVISGTSWLEIDQWHQEIGKLDVGIVPLGSTAFNRGKSALKGIEYAARGVPFVASALPEYEALAEQGVGVIAPERGRSWRKELTQLMDDESLRAEMIERGREVVHQQFTYEGQGWRWPEVWESVL